MTRKTFTSKIRVLPEPVGPVDPPPGDGDEPIAQYMAWDGEFGAYRRDFVEVLHLRWRNYGVGDWLDANGIEQGPEPFTTFSLTRDVLDPVTIDVTPIVIKQILSGENKGIFFQAAGSNNFVYRFAGRAHENAAAQPKLQVVTTTGTYTLPARANPSWGIASGTRAFDRRARFSVQRNQIAAMIQFDYGPITGAVTAATLTIVPVEVPRSGQIAVFEADPPPYLLGRTSASRMDGISSIHLNDDGVGAHPNVVFASDFTDGAGNFSGAGWSSNVNTGKVLMQDPDTGLYFLRCELTPNRQEMTGGDFSHTLAGAGTAPFEHPVDYVGEMSFRYRVRIHPNYKSGTVWPPYNSANVKQIEEGTKFPGFNLRWGYRKEYGGWAVDVAGNGGRPGNGRFEPLIYNRNEDTYPAWHPLAGQRIRAFHGHMNRGHCGLTSPLDPSPHAAELNWLGQYIYHIDQSGLYGDSVRWGNSVVRYGQWHDIEQRMKMNTLYGPEDEYGNQEAAYDGELEVWVDGNKVFDRRNLRWSKHKRYGIQSVWVGFFHGGKMFPTQTMNVDIGNFVIAKSYIGPLRLE